MPVTQYLFKDNDVLTDYLKDINVKSLLNHSSGLIPWFPFYTKKDMDLENVLEIIINDNKIDYGTMRYSDINFILLGKLIEVVSGLNLDLAMKEIVIDKLSLQNTDYSTKSSNIAATEYGNKIETNMVKERDLVFSDFRNDSIPIIGQVNDGNCHYYFNGVSGHAGLFSTVNDLDMLCNFYINRGSLNNKSYIKEEIIEKSFVNYGQDRGLGWQLGQLYPDGVGHTGFTGTSIYLDLKSNANVVLLTNRLHVNKPVNIANFRLAIHNKVHHLIR